MRPLYRSSGQSLRDNRDELCGDIAAAALTMHETRVEIHAVSRIEREFFIAYRNDHRAFEYQVEFLATVCHELRGSSRENLGEFHTEFTRHVVNRGNRNSGACRLPAQVPVKVDLEVLRHLFRSHISRFPQPLHAMAYFTQLLAFLCHNQLSFVRSCCFILAQIPNQTVNGMLLDAKTTKVGHLASDAK